MRLCVLVPNDGSLGQAGVRIRYQRLAEPLDAAGHSLEIKIIDDIRTAADLVHDIYILSKCQDARSIIFAREVRRGGKLLGVDLFDDYFSQSADSRFTPQRSWLRGVSTWCDFGLCSTSRMKRIAAEFMADLPIHILNDPFDRIEPERIGRVAERNLERSINRRSLQVAWFGNGDNPHFSVGLKDVHAFGHALHELGRTGMEIRLSLLTNRRALGAGGLESLNRLAVKWTAQEWSLAAEEELLSESLVAFIPTNAQPFSIAKSLNRAVSALTAGTQVLSVGFPLYAPLGEFIYRDPAGLLADLELRTLRLRRATLATFVDRLESWADPQREALRLVAFLEATVECKPEDRSIRRCPLSAEAGIVHGLRSGADVHQTAQRHRIMSIASPYSHESLNYDLRFTAPSTSQALSVELEPRTLPRLRPDVQPLLERSVSRSGRPVFRFALETLFPIESACIANAFLARKSRLATFATYEPVMEAVFHVVGSMFPGVDLVLSEMEAPYGASKAFQVHGGRESYPSQGA